MFVISRVPFCAFFFTVVPSLLFIHSFIRVTFSFIYRPDLDLPDDLVACRPIDLTMKMTVLEIAA